MFGVDAVHFHLRMSATNCTRSLRYSPTVLRANLALVKTDFDCYRRDRFAEIASSQELRFGRLAPFLRQDKQCENACYNENRFYRSKMSLFTVFSILAWFYEIMCSFQVLPEAGRICITLSATVNHTAIMTRVYSIVKPLKTLSF